MTNNSQHDNQDTDEFEVTVSHNNFGDPCVQIVDEVFAPMTPKPQNTAMVRSYHDSWLAPDRKLPVHVSDKSFPFFSYKLYKVFVTIKNLFLSFKDVVSPDVSEQSTTLLLESAHGQREVMNVMRIQKLVRKLTKEVMKAIRNNQDIYYAEVGDYTTDCQVLAEAAKRHFSNIGYPSDITASHDKVYITIHIRY